MSITAASASSAPSLYPCAQDYTQYVSFRIIRRQDGKGWGTQGHPGAPLRAEPCAQGLVTHEGRRQVDPTPPAEGQRAEPHIMCAP